LSDLSLERVEKILVLVSTHTCSVNRPKNCYITDQFVLQKATDSEYAAMKDHIESNPDLPLDRADKYGHNYNTIYLPACLCILIH